MKPKLIFIILSLAVVLSGCAEAKQETMDIRDDTTARFTILDKTPEKTDEASVLTLSMRKPLTLNPLMNTDATVDKVLKLVFEPLFNISEDQSVIPNLGSSYTLSADGTSMTVKLKDGLKWQDGEPITAGDVVYSLDTIRNAPEDSVYKYCLMNIADYYTTDELTLVIDYSSPYSPCAYNLTFPVIPRHYYSGRGSQDLLPMGDGAYSLVSYDTAGCKLTAAQGINGTPKIQNVNVVISPDETTDFDAFNQGVTDVFDTCSADWFSVFSQKDCNRAPYSSNYFEYLGFNNNKEMFKNQAVRQAIAYSIDREQILSGIYMNNLEDSLTPVNPTAYMSSKESLPRYDYSPDEALKTLWNAGLSPYNYTFSILVNSDNSARVETANIIADSLNSLGMKVTVNPKPFAEYTALLNSDEFDVFLGGTNLRCGFDLRPLLLSSSVYSGTNYVNFSDAKMDTLLNAYLTTINEDQRKLALREVERYISIQLPLIGLGFRDGVVLSDKELLGVTIPYINDCYVNCEKWSFD